MKLLRIISEYILRQRRYLEISPLKKLQMIALAAVLATSGAHAAVAEATVTTQAAAGWTVGSVVTALGGTYVVVGIVAGVATLAAVAANQSGDGSSGGGTTGTTGTVAN